MLTLIATVVLTQGPMPAHPPAPTAYESAQLYFASGDLSSAREWCERGLKKEAKRCGPFLKRLAEYRFLMGKFDELSLEEAASAIALDKALAKAPGKLTIPIIERFVLGPMQRAKSWAEQGAAAEAVRFVDDVLKVDPSNVDARALKKTLVALAKDAGP